MWLPLNRIVAQLKLSHIFGIIYVPNYLKELKRTF